MRELCSLIFDVNMRELCSLIFTSWVAFEMGNDPFHSTPMFTSWVAFRDGGSVICEYNHRTHRFT